MPPAAARSSLRGDKEAARGGVRFRFETQVERIIAGAQPGLVVARTPRDPRDEAVSGSRAGFSGWSATEPEEEMTGEIGFDAVVVCAALGSDALLRPLGVRLPLQPVYGYSVTAPLRHDEQHLHLEPRAALMDERYKVAISRFGNRVRVAGSAEIGGPPGRQNEAAQLTLDTDLARVMNHTEKGVGQRSECLARILAECCDRTDHREVRSFVGRRAE